MYILNENNRKMPLDTLIEFAIYSPPLNDSEDEICRNEFYINDDNLLIWEFYKKSISDTVPLSVRYYKVVL